MISIIMPLYNAGCFLKETLQSIANQTYKDYELICIDDASEDMTLNIIKGAQVHDARIKLLTNQKKMGAAFSRNRGMEYAVGDYIAFLDGDDIFDEKMLEKAYECAKENSLDIIVFEYLHVESENIYEKKHIYRDEQFREIYCRTPYSILDMRPEQYYTWADGPCNKLFRRQFIVENELNFQSLTSSNDVYFVEMAFLFADRIMNLDDNKVMVYARDHDTPTRISFDRDPMCVYDAWNKILDEVYKRERMGQLYEHCYLRCLFTLLGAFTRAKTDIKKEEYYSFLKKEGINKLKNKGNYYALLDSKLKKIYERFIEEDYNTQWFKQINIVSYLVPKNRDKFYELFIKYRNILVWGAGNYGRELINALSKMGLDIYTVVDTNKALRGKKIGHYTILNREDVDFKKVDMIIVALRKAFEEVKQELNGYDVPLIDLNEFIGME